MSSGMPPEGLGIFVKMASSCEQLSDAVEDKNKKAALRALIKCAMSNMHLFRLEGMDKLGIELILFEEDEEKFKNELTELLGQ